MRRNKEINRPLKRYIAQWVGVGTMYGRVVWAIKQENGYSTVIYYMYVGTIRYCCCQLCSTMGWSQFGQNSKFYSAVTWG